MPDRGEIARTEAARALWGEARAIQSTVAETYLEHRGLIEPWPLTLRYHPNLKHAATGLYFPVLVAAVHGLDGKLIGIQRTYLRPDGRDKAGLSQPRMSLGRIAGGAVRLARAVDHVWVCEGIEDALSIDQLFQEPAWAVLGTGGFGSIELPDDICTVVLAPDRDNAGQAVIEQAAARLAGQGHEVRIARPQTAKDWNAALGDGEERSAIMEFDDEVVRQDASRAVAGEVLRGRS